MIPDYFLTFPVAGMRLNRSIQEEKPRLTGESREADDRARTGDPLLGRQMLYQLSYVRVWLA